MAAGAVRALHPIATSDVLASYEVSLPTGAGGALGLAARHLELLGARLRPRAGVPSDRLECALPGTSRASALDTSRASTPSISGWVRRWWDGPDGSDPDADETLAQAVSGLMAVHGRDDGTPRRLGLDVCSAAAGILATQGILAALIGSCRGGHGSTVSAISTVETSTLRGALQFLVHHLAIATADGTFPYRPGGPAPGPPFGTADGHWVELEVLSGDDWFGFWRRLGVDRMDVVGAAWLPFVYRYLAGRCALPGELHDATRRHTLAQVRAAAQAAGVALGRLRTEGPRPGDPAATPWLLRPHAAAPGADPAAPRAACTVPAAVRTGPAAVSRAVGPGPLGGIRVVEVTSRLQGPLAGQLLRQLGAEVIKVEPPGGDFGRASPPLARGTGAAYRAYNRGTRVVELDYKRPTGRAELADLMATADVFLHNWRPGRAEELGLTAADAGRCNPAIVYAYASGWGDAPDAPAAIAGDYLVQAHAGCGTGLHPPGEPPFPSRVTLVDVLGGLIACEGVLAGLYLRERTGRGCGVDTSLLAAAAAPREVPGRSAPRWDALSGPAATADGYLMVSAGTAQARRRLAGACGLAGTPGAGAIANRLRERRTTQWLAALHDVGVPAAAVRTELAGLADDARTAALVERADDACWVPAAPWTFQSSHP